MQKRICSTSAILVGIQGSILTLVAIIIGLSPYFALAGDPAKAVGRPNPASGQYSADLRPLAFIPTPWSAQKRGKQRLRCSHIAKLGEWSRQHHVQGKSIKLKNRAFARRLGQLFAEKLDPQKLLFTKAEVKKLVHLTQKFGWKTVITQHDCRFFEKWTRKYYPIALRRWQKHLATLTLNTPASLSSQKSNLTNPLSAAPKRFAKNAKQLQHRLKEAVKEIYSSTTEMIVQAYGNNHYQLLVDSFELYGAIKKPDALTALAKAMLSAFDLHSTFFSKTEFKEFYADLSGTSTSLGIQIRKVPSGLFIEKIMDDSPAARSKRLAIGDIITAVNKTGISRTSYEQAKELLKGKEKAGEAVHLSIQRTHKQKKRRFSLVLKREPLRLEDAKVSYEIWKPRHHRNCKVAVIKIPSFYGRGGLSSLKEERSVSEDVEDTLLKILTPRKKPSALILDLRGNPGGYLEEAVTIAGLFLGSRPVVSILEENDYQVLSNPHTKAIYQGPLLVLVDSESASAAEVLAGALKDYGRAILVGSKETYGKGSIQRLYRLDEPFPLITVNGAAIPGALKLTTSYFYSPSGHSPAAQAIRTDIIIPEPDTMKPTEKAAPNTAHSVPKGINLVGKNDIRRVIKTRRLLKKQVSLLKQKSQRRCQDSPSSINKPHQQPTKAQAHPPLTQPILREAVEIAADCVKISHKNKDLSKVYSPESPVFIREARRGMIVQ